MARRRARWQLAAAMVATAMVATACGTSSSGSGGGNGADKPYRALLLASLTGPAASSGEAVKAAFLAAVDVVNANGGIDGRHVETTIKDDKGDPAEVATLVSAAIASNNPPDYIQPGLTSTETIAALPIASQAGILSGGSAGAATLGDADKLLFFGASPVNADAAAATVDKLAKQGAKSMAVAVVDGESGVPNIEAYQAAAKAAGIKVTGVEKVAFDALDATSQVERLRAGNPDALVLSMFGPPVKPVMEARKTLGWDVPVWGDQVTAATPLVQLLGPDLLKQMTLVTSSYTVAGSETGKSQGIQTALAAIKKQVGGDLKLPANPYIVSYMPLILVKYSADLAKSTDAKAVHDARMKLKLSDMPLYAGSSQLFTDPKSNFMTFPPEDFVAVPGGPLVGGLFAPGQ